MSKEKLTDKKKEIEAFKSCLDDFWGEEPTKRGIVSAWKDYIDSLRETYDVPASWYKLTMEEKRELYRTAGLE